MNIPQKIRELGLKSGSYVIVGSGILDALKIRESGDIDIIVSNEVYKKFEEKGWQKASWPDQVVLKHGVFDLGKNWYGETVDDLISDATLVDDIPYLSLDTVYEWKKLRARDKDLKDLALIEAYKARSNFVN